MSELQVERVILGAGIAGTWLAHRLSAMGKRVALVDIGPRPGAQVHAASPEVRFAERENLGVTKARNQVVTGNSRFWGGGLIRNDDASIQRMFAVETGSPLLESMKRAYGDVERELGAPCTPRRTLDGTGCSVGVINVLPGRRRDVVGGFVPPDSGSSRNILLDEARIVEVGWDGPHRLSSLTIESPRAGLVTVHSGQIVLSMGVVDSNIFALKHLVGHMPATGENVGTCLHDHWSVPIATMRWKRGCGLDDLYPLRFSRGFIQGSRAEVRVETPWGSQAGFIHLQANYDQHEPYATIKALLDLRQKGATWATLMPMAARLASQPGRFAKVAIGRLVKGMVYVPDGMELSVVVDFESHANRANRFTAEEGKPVLHWDVREEDHLTFSRMFRAAKAMLEDVGDCNALQVEFRSNDSPGGLEELLRRDAIDAYHLGGGLASGRDSTSCLEGATFRLREIGNLAVLSTAAFACPGVANPVQTLLAMAEILAREEDRT